MTLSPLQLFAAVLALAVSAAPAGAQNLQHYALKNGETIEVGSLYYTANCRSIMTALPEVEIMEGPDEVKLAVREEQVLPRRQGCANKIAGGMLTMTAKDVTEKKEAKLTYRTKYKTKDGDRQISHSVIVALFP